MSDRVPVINGAFQLQQFNGKGGWTYVSFPEFTYEKHNTSGGFKISGTIDQYEINSQSLLPMGRGKLMLTVNATIRQQIKKQAGDTVHITLYRDIAPLNIDTDFIESLKEEPETYRFFNQLADTEQKSIINWIKSAKTESNQIERIAQVINNIAFNKTIPVIND